jgi:hypothetical protein
MDIYLVRISERADKTLYVERKPNATTKDEYVAISHVWGVPEAITKTHVEGVGIIELSPGKRDILSILRREDICDDDWFWLDLFCIDQSPDPVIPISDQLKAIPEIYKSSRCVKILIESPVCLAWQSTARRVADEGVQDMAVFAEEELRHSRKCPNMLFMDPWFDRLWTRQEGLYAQSIQVVVLNPVPCARFPIISSNQRPPPPPSAGDRWIAEGEASLKRAAVETFLADKLAYHGLSTKRQDFGNQIYLDLVYKHRVFVENLGGVVGPHSNYSPFGEAWRSGRQTTKPCDYVLAVFPDIEGYRPPRDARHLPFPQLLEDAFNQVSGQGKNFYFLPKVLSGMMAALDSQALLDPYGSFIVSKPSNVTEAFDTFLAVKRSISNTVLEDGLVYVVAESSVLEKIDFSREGLPKLVGLWESTANTISHMLLAAPSGPCTGSSRIAHSKEGLLHRYLAHLFARSAIATYSTDAKFKDLRAHGLVDVDKLNIGNDVFEFELKRFLICLVCGTTLTTATLILQAVDIRLISTAYGKLLALINKRFVSCKTISLVSTGFSECQGLLIAVQDADGKRCRVVGRTWIASARVDSVTDVTASRKLRVEGFAA